MSPLKAFILSALLSPALARFPLARRVSPAPRDLECVEDDVYTLFHDATASWLDPWCSSYLSIQDVPSTSNAYSAQTTTITTTTTTTPFIHTANTVDYVATVTTTIGNKIGKRAPIAAPAPTPAAQLAGIAQLYSELPLVASCDENPQDRTLASVATSACSCLMLEPGTTPLFVTTTSTRTETAILYQPSDTYTTVTGYSTTTVTVLATPINNNTFPGSTGFLSSALPTSPSSYISGSPTPSPNISTTTSPSTTSSGTIPFSTSPTFSSTSPVNNTTSASIPPFSIPSDSSNRTGASSTSSAPSSASTCPPDNPFWAGCPSRDNTFLSEQDGENYLIMCYTIFTGPTAVGLDEPTLGACVQQCALDNDGFNNIFCYGVTYFPNVIGPNCYLKTQAQVATADRNPCYQAVSATLTLNSTNTTSSSIPPSMSPTGPSNSSSTSAPTSTSPLTFPSFTNSDDRTGNGPTGGPSTSSSLTGPYNITSAAGPTAPPSVNTTSLGPYPTNSTSTYGPTAPPTPGNTTSSGPYPTNITSTYGPTAPPLSNSTTDLWPFPTNTTSNVGPTAPPIPSNSSASVTPSNSLNSTAPPSITPTPSYNVTSTPSGFPTSSANYTNSNATTNSRGFSTYPTTNASTCISTDWITAYTNECLFTSTLYVTTTASAAHSATKTLTETFTLTA